MKIVILGAGQVGSTVAESLVSEANDITVVDTSGPRLRELQDRLDLRTVVGHAAHPSTLRQAGIDDADMVIAVTQSDETNLVACKLAAQLFNVPTRIARVRATEYQQNEKIFSSDGFSVDFSICPEQLLTDYIVKLVEFPESEPRRLVLLDPPIRDLVAATQRFHARLKRLDHGWRERASDAPSAIAALRERLGQQLRS